MSKMSEHEIEVSRELREHQMPVVGCSQCGGDFPKPPNAIYANGFSHCEDHQRPTNFVVRRPNLRHPPVAIARLEAACTRYDEWYTRGRSTDAGNVAYDLVSVIRETLQDLRVPEADHEN